MQYITLLVVELNTYIWVKTGLGELGLYGFMALITRCWLIFRRFRVHALVLAFIFYQGGRESRRQCEREKEGDVIRCSNFFCWLHSKMSPSRVMIHQLTIISSIHLVWAMEFLKPHNFWTGKFYDLIF